MPGRVVVVGLGPGDPGSLTAATAAAIAATPVRFLRTARHPTASAVGDAESFDRVYEAGASLDEVYATIAGTVAAAAAEHGQVLYAVPGSPLVAERTVELLRADGGVEVEVLPALSFLDLAWLKLGIDPVAAGARLVDGHRFAVEAAGERGPLLVAQCDTRLVLSDIKLAVEADPGPVVVLRRLGLPDEAVAEVSWADLDRAFEPDHLTCLWIPHLAEPVAAEAVRLVELVRTLRARCPWDQVQTHESLRRHLLEETYEVLDAIDELPTGAGWEHLEEELGDLLFQVVFHAQLAAEEGQFSLADLAAGVHDKLVARHPHVFGPESGQVVTPEGLDLTWEQRKKAEKGRTSVTEGIPAALPSLAYALKLQRRATSLGLDWPDAAAVKPTVLAELAELDEAVAAGDAAAVDGEVGDVLFSLVNLARKLDVEPELALRAAARRFGSRVAAVERLAAERGLDDAALAGLDPAALDGLWQEAKRATG